ncbi:MAG: cation:proton antiporter [Candidatus Krumholzibacteria bacterium]|nr:cation:proton antiporter [Candidatus Krumholzibacteria bacterium]
MHFSLESPALTVALALAAGMIAQAVARHLRIPGIVVLLVTGVLMGPDLLGVVRPEVVGDALHLIVGFAIAVILFEGGLNLEWRRLRREAGPIRKLVTIGALMTWGGAVLSARAILGWDWPLAVLFGSLVIVTGPTVITPILRRFKIRHNLETILEAEGIFIDAIGAIIAVVSLEVVLSYGQAAFLHGAVSAPTRLLVGGLVGLAGGFAAALLLRARGWVPEGLENVFTLSLAIAIFHVSNALASESGIVAAIVAGMVVGNMRSGASSDLREFKEQLTVMFIGMLFVLLAADVRAQDVAALGVPGALVVLVLSLVVRPLQVLACTAGEGLQWRERGFLAWLAPRGIVAAAVSSLFYDRMTAAGMPGGVEVRALVFMVIAATVVVQGGLAGVVARWLGVLRPRGQGYAILGAHDLAAVLAGVLRDSGEPVVMIDANPQTARHAQEAGFRVVHGSALEERVHMAAQIDTRRAVVAMLTNDGINLLFARKAREEYDVGTAYVAIPRGHGALSPAIVEAAGARVLFANEVDVELWDVRARRGLTSLRLMRFTGTRSEEGTDAASLEIPKEEQNLLLPLARVSHSGAVTPVGDGNVATDIRVYWLVFAERENEALRWLESNGWESAAETAGKDGV